MGLSQFVGSAVTVPMSTLDVVLAAPEHTRTALAEVQRLAGQIWRLVGRTNLLLGRISLLLDSVETLVAAAALTRDEAQAVIDRTGRLSDAAEAPVALATEETQRVKRLLDEYEQQLRGLAPLLRQAALDLSPQHLHAVGQLHDRIPVFLDLVEPALRNLANLAPELEEVTERMDSVGEIVEGLPGAGMLRRRSKAKEEHA